MDIRRRSSMSVPNKSSSEVQGSYTVNLNGQWLKSSYISNPDSTLYDGVYESFSNKGVNSSGATMYIDISGYSTFTLYIRSYAESSYDYVMVSLLDKDITYNSSYSDTTLIKAHTRGNLQSGTAIGSYTKVEFTGIGSGNHRITIVYRKDSSLHSGDDRGYVLISKNNLNFEEPEDPEEDIIDTSEYFTIESWEDGNNISFNKEILYAKNNGSWNTLSAGSTITLNNGDTAAFKRTIVSLSSSNYGQFTIPKLCEVRGNIMSLAFGDDFKNQTSLYNKTYRFYRLFYNCDIVNASLLLLPATTLGEYCYQYMFWNCTSLITAPELPATTLADYCYESMFRGCTSLVTAPELPATTLVNPRTTCYCYQNMFYGCTSLINAPSVLPATVLLQGCYQNMFSGCTSLINAPELPATNLSDRCYEYMFYGCTSLVNAPELPATGVRKYCYASMFSGCTSLVTAPELPSTNLYEYCYQNMFSGCTSLINAPKLSARNLNTNCYANMFYGCTSLVNAPELPASLLNNNCYQNMFYGCTSLVNAPELPATTLKESCYYCMFKNCTKLSKIKMMAINVSASLCLDNWVYGVSPTGTFVKNKNATWDKVGSSGVPSGWTIIKY